MFSQQKIDPQDAQSGLNASLPVLGKVEKVNDANFSSLVLKADRPVLVDFYADWCGPCRAMSPIIEQLARENGADAIIAKADIADSIGTATQYGVQSIPRILIFKDGKVVADFVGVVSKAKLQKALDANK